MSQISPQPPPPPISPGGGDGHWWRWLSAAVIIALVASGATYLSLFRQSRSSQSSSRTPSSQVELPAQPQIVFSSDQSVVLTSIGSTYQFAAQVETSARHVVHEPLQWVSDDPGAVVVSPSGEVTAKVGLGSASIMVSAPGAQGQMAQVAIAVPEPNTLVISSTDVLAQSQDAATLRLNAQTKAVKVGDILVSGSKAGLLVRVLSVAVGAQGVNVTTSTASLTAAFTALSINEVGASATATLSSGGLTSTDRMTSGNMTTGAELLADVTGTDNAAALAAGSHALVGARASTAAANEHTMQCKQNTGVSVLVSLSGASAKVNPSAHLVVQLATKSNNILHLLLAVQVQLSVVIDTGSVHVWAAGTEDVTCTWQIGSMSLPDVPIGPFTVSGVVTASAGLDVVGTAQGALALTGPTLTYTPRLEDGIEYTSSKGWKSVASKPAASPVVTPPDATLASSLSIKFAPSARIDLGITGSLGRCDLTIPIFNKHACWTFAQANLAYATLIGDVQFQISSPILPMVAGYTGPSWSAGLEIRAGPEISFSGPIPDLLSRIGINLPSVQWNLLDVRIPLAGSPPVSAEFSGSTIPGGSATLTALVPRGYIGDSVEFVAYPKEGVGIVVASSNVASDDTATAQWTIPAPGLAAYSIVALLAAAPFGSRLPYASPAGTATPVIAVALGKGVVSMYTQDGRLIGQHVMNWAAPGPNGVYFVSGSTLSRMNPDGSIQQLQTNLPIPTASDTNHEFLGPVVSPDGTQWVYGSETVSWNTIALSTVTRLFFDSIGQRPRQVAQLSRGGAGYRPTAWGSEGIVLAADPQGVGGAPNPFSSELYEYGWPVVILNPSTGTVSTPISPSGCRFGDIAATGAVACVITDDRGLHGDQILIIEPNGSTTHIALPENDGVGGLKFTLDSKRITFSVAHCWSGGCTTGWTESSYSASVAGGVSTLAAKDAVVTGFLPDGSALAMGCASESAAAVPNYDYGFDGRIGVLNPTTGVTTTVISDASASAAGDLTPSYAWVIPSNGSGSGQWFAPCM